jgi:hypothetical protein
MGELAKFTSKFVLDFGVTGQFDKRPLFDRISKELRVEAVYALRDRLYKYH